MAFEFDWNEYIIDYCIDWQVHCRWLHPIRVLHIRLGVYMWYLGLYLYHIGYMTHIKDYALHLRQLTQLLMSFISVLQTSVKGGSPRPVLWTVINLGLREYVL